ncbi:MAG: PAS domain S-box protein [Proteobacteria bacterium]|nr:PAS domain S-box protein [Pseudomonadota bacterium]
MKRKDKNKTKEQLLYELLELSQKYKKVEETLKESEERYRGVIDNIGIGISLISPRMEILSLNNQMKKWFPDVDVSEKPICYQAFNNPPRESICSYCPTYKTLKDGKVHESVTETPAGDKIIYFRIISSPLKNKKGNIIAAIEMVDDITRQKRLDELLKREKETFYSILQKAPYGVMLIDKDGDYLYVNEEFVNITGYTLKDVPDGKHWFKRVYPDKKYRKEAIDAWKNDITKKGVTQIFTIRCKDGKRKKIEFRPNLLDDGRYILMLSDITKRRQAEEALKNAHDELEKRIRERTAELEKINKDLQNEMVTRKQVEEKTIKLNEELEQRIIELNAVNKELKTFNYSVSHDLRTPLIAIEGFSRRLLEKYGDQFDTKGQQFLSMIHSSTKQMQVLIENLLSFFSLGRKTIRFSAINIDKIVREIFGQFKAMYPEPTMRLTIQSTPAANGDKAMIKQVLVNLLSNAVKYSKPEGPIDIEVGGWVEKGNNIYYVKDNGIGFQMKYADKVFEVLERLHGSGEFEGTGIGLAIVKRVIHRHGGKVWAEAKINEGATFYFSLPIKNDFSNGEDSLQ